MKAWAVIALAVLLVGSVAAHDDHPEHSSFEQAEGIINADLPCDMLTENQLEALGEYYMEQMHPGEAHERMDAIMGGEGSESLKQAHMNLAKRFYCGQSWISMFNLKNGAGGMTQMMNGLYGSWMIVYAIIIFGVAAFIASLIFWLVYQWLFKNKEKGKQNR